MPTGMPTTKISATVVVTFATPMMLAFSRVAWRPITYLPTGKNTSDRSIIKFHSLMPDIYFEDAKEQHDEQEYNCESGNQ